VQSHAHSHPTIKSIKHARARWHAALTSHPSGRLRRRLTPALATKEQAVVFSRITATYNNEGILEDEYKIVILCMTDNGKLSAGEWFGYVQNESVKHPFILHKGIAFLYGDETNISEPTDFGSISPVKGGTFTLTTSSRLGEPVADKYEITHVHTYD
jgi:hypothetical protein